MPRFFVPAVLSPGQTLALPDSVVRHIHVLRLRPDSGIVLFNGDGCSYPARLLNVDKRAAAAHILQVLPADSEPPLHITLVQAVSAGEKMDFTLQKSVELGVSEIWPVISERSVVRLSGERADKKTGRWQDIVISACEQSGRNLIPPVQPLQPFVEALLRLPEADARMILSPNRAGTLSRFAAPQRLILMVGPEGGWTAAEEEAAFAAGFQAVTLGPRILRTETAALAAIAAMQTLWGDFV